MSDSPNRSKFSSTALLCLAVVVPCGLSLWSVVSPASLPPLRITKERPSLLFGTYLYHHGDEAVALDSTLESEFRFRNDGNQPVEIGTIERSCGCMTPRLTQTTIAPGESGALLVPLQTIYQAPGPHEYTLTVHYTDPKPREVTLAIKATFPEKMVVVQPKALYLSQQSDKSVPFDVTINDFREQTLTVRSVESTSPFVSAELAEQTASGIIQTSFEESESSVAAKRLKIHGTVSGSIPPGRHHAVVAALTNDTEFGIVTVPMIVNGPAYPRGAAPVVSPPQIQLMASDHPKARRRAKVQVVIPADWEVSHATAWPREISVEYGAAQPFAESEVMIPVNIELSQVPTQKVTDAVVQLFANDGRNLVTIRTTLVWP